MGYFEEQQLVDFFTPKRTTYMSKKQIARQDKLTELIQVGNIKEVNSQNLKEQHSGTTYNTMSLGHSNWDDNTWVG